MNSNDLEDFGPTIETPGARRDPRLSIERDHQPRRLPSPPEIPKGWTLHLLLAILIALAAIVIVLTLAGILAHLNWNVLVWAWRLVP